MNDSTLDAMTTTTTTTTTTTNSELTAAAVSIPTTTVALEDLHSNNNSNNNNPNNNHTLSTTHVQIALDADERALFQVLTATAVAYNAGLISLNDSAADSVNNNTNNTTTPAQEPLVFRVAGGWVRDKLLQLETHDVDIAVNTLTGAQAALLVKEYVQYQKITKSPAMNPAVADSVTLPDMPLPPLHAHRQISTGRIGVIAANPAQSKHLETATMNVAGITVDFCNLRGSEVYVSDSRIPTSRFGTAHDDAMRRDFTLNALFYNLTTRQVEDWTCRGIRDLQAGWLVTPLEPQQTFLDDPLRVLRAIRFCVRYQFVLDPAMEQAARNETIHHALHVKVSRERVGKELKGMVSGKGANPILALQTISRLQLAGSVFFLPIVGQDKVGSMQGQIAGVEYTDENHNGAAARHIRARGWVESLRYLKGYCAVVQAHDVVVAARHENNDNNNNNTMVTSYDRSLTPVAAYLLPFRRLVYQETNKKKDISALSFCFRNGLKFKNADVQFITRLVETLDIMLDLLTAAAATTTTTTIDNNNRSSNSSGTTRRVRLDRLQAGLVLQSIRELWVTSLLLATVVKLCEQSPQQQQQESEPSSTALMEQHEPNATTGTAASSSAIDWIQVSMQVYQTILELQLDGCWNIRPLMDGRALIQTLHLVPGPLIKTYHDEQLRWMLQNPTGSVHECETHLSFFKRTLEQTDDDDDDAVIGKSDGTGPSSPLPGPNKTVDHAHFSKKMHVESMELS